MIRQSLVEVSTKATKNLGAQVELNMILKTLRVALGRTQLGSNKRNRNKRGSWNTRRNHFGG